MPPPASSKAPVRWSFSLYDAGGREPFGTAVITPPPTILTSVSRLRDIPDFVWLAPDIGQQGHALQIVGPFDGASDNTWLTWTSDPGSLQDDERSLPASGVCELVAESPRKAVFRAPIDVAGPSRIRARPPHEGRRDRLRRPDFSDFAGPRSV